MATAYTPRDLFRAGNKTSAKFDQLRPGEVSIFQQAGEAWVVGRSGGASTVENAQGRRGTWYRLPQGTAYDDQVLYLWNDLPDHWAWEPMRHMRLSDYVAALAVLNAEFIRF